MLSTYHGSDIRSQNEQKKKPGSKLLDPNQSRIWWCRLSTVAVTQFRDRAPGISTAPRAQSWIFSEELEAGLILLPGTEVTVE